MIVGVGTDLCDVRRVSDALQRRGERFAAKVLGPQELVIFRQRHAAVPLRGLRFLASRFAAKEAFSKAIGLGMHGPMTWLSCEILNAPSGQPQIVLNGDLAVWFAEKNWKSHVSLTDEGDHALAFVVIETQPSSP